MISLTGLNGATILVAPKTIFRVRPAVPSEGAETTKVEYAGGYLFTLEPLADLITRLADAGIRLIALTTRSGTIVMLNPGSISRVRDSLPINGPGTEIVVSGLYQHVVETVAEVEALLT